MKIYLLIGLAACVGMIDSGCSPARSQTAKASAPQRSGSANPMERYDEERVRQALRGLTFTERAVTIDQKEAAAISPRTTLVESDHQAAVAENLLQRNDSVAALAAFTKAIVMRPENAHPYEGLGRALITKGETEKARAAMSTAVSFDPKFANAHYQLGMLNQMDGKLDEAIAEWKSVLRTNPSRAETNVRIAVASYYLERYADAWLYTHRAEAIGQTVPPQFRELLAAQMKEPAKR